MILENLSQKRRGSLKLLHMLNGPIKEILVLVQLEEHEKVEVDFHPHYHHQKLELKTCQGSWK